MLKNGFLTFCCAFIPGAGQMYQGYMKRGLSLILTACLIGMVSSLLNPVLLLLVVVWMYSFFDTFNLRAQILADTAPEDDYLIHFDPRDKRLARALLDSHKLVGWLLIAFGALIAYQNLIMNTLGDLVYRWGHSSPVFRALYLVMDSLPDVVVCVVLIVCGVWLVKGPHPAKKPDASKDAPEDADFCEYHADAAAQPENAPLLSGPVVNENEVTDDDFDHEDADFCEYHADEPDNAALLSSPVVNENEVTDDGTEHDE